MDAGEATRLYGELQKAAPLEALSLGTDSQQERAERAQALQEVEIVRHEAIYRAAFGSTVDPDPDHLFGLALNVRHAGNLQAVLADPDLEFAFARVLDVHTTEVFVSDEDGQRWEPSSPRSDRCVETGFQVALADLRGGRDVRHADFERAVDEASRSLDGELVEPLSPNPGLNAEPATHVPPSQEAAAGGRLVISRRDEERLRAIQGRSSWASEYEAEVLDAADMPERAAAARQEATGMWDEADSIAQRYGFAGVDEMYDHIDEHGVEISAHLSEDVERDVGDRGGPSQQRETPSPDADPPRQLSPRDEPREKVAEQIEQDGQRWESVQHRPSRAEQLDMAVIAPAVAAAAITR